MEQVAHSRSQGLVGDLKAVLMRAQPGDVLLEGVHLSQFELLCQEVDQRGLSFSVPTSSLDQPDPLGTVSLQLDPRQTHECAAGVFGRELGFWHLTIGAVGYVCPTGSGRFPFTPGRSKEPDYSYKCKPHVHEDDPPTLVLECAESQASANMLEDVITWVHPRPEGGGAQVAVGLDIKFKGGRTQLPDLEACLCLAGYPGVQRLAFGAGTECGRGGDPRFFLWLPLSHLLPGAGPLARAWWCLVAAMWGAVQGACAWLRMPPWQALRLTAARCRAPWGAVPVDLSRIARAVAALRGLQLPGQA